MAHWTVGRAISARVRSPRVVQARWLCAQPRRGESRPLFQDSGASHEMELWFEVGDVEYLNDGLVGRP
ncbi:MAG: hypothetical protein GY720_09170 [bacterium]|nr:hypothetical protein [bacterium]